MISNSIKSFKFVHDILGLWIHLAYSRTCLSQVLCTLTPARNQHCVPSNFGCFCWSRELNTIGSCLVYFASRSNEFPKRPLFCCPKLPFQTDKRFAAQNWPQLRLDPSNFARLWGLLAKWSFCVTVLVPTIVTTTSENYSPLQISSLALNEEWRCFIKKVLIRLMMFDRQKKWPFSQKNKLNKVVYLLTKTWFTVHVSAKTLLLFLKLLSLGNEIQQHRSKDIKRSHRFFKRIFSWIGTKWTTCASFFRRLEHGVQPEI